jgi:hypothetical protein
MLDEEESGLSFSEYGFIQHYRQEFRDIIKKLKGYIDWE